MIFLEVFISILTTLENPLAMVELTVVLAIMRGFTHQGHIGG